MLRHSSKEMIVSTSKKQADPSGHAVYMSRGSAAAR
jgi:hypothetical protein